MVFFFAWVAEIVVLVMYNLFNRAIPKAKFPIIEIPYPSELNQFNSFLKRRR